VRDEPGTEGEWKGTQTSSIIAGDSDTLLRAVKRRRRTSASGLLMVEVVGRASAMVASWGR
jgi:hypothetical protein